VPLVSTKVISVTGASGGAGAATATVTTDEVVNGIIRGVHLGYIGSPPATTDVTIATASAPTVPILTVSDANSDAWIYPMGQAVDPSNSDITGMGVPIAINDRVVVTIAQANDNDGVTVTLVLEIT
jgi:hypothetical protein